MTTFVATALLAVSMATAGTAAAAPTNLGRKHYQAGGVADNGDEGLPALTAVAAKPTCQHYFGNDTTDHTKQITVVDPDVTQGFPFANNTFIHHTGVGSLCISPGPPEGCHRYYKVLYDGCDELSQTTGPHTTWAGTEDTKGLFDRASGVLKSCADKVKSFEVFCFGEPADDPVPCACPGTPPAAQEL